MKNSVLAVSTFLLAGSLTAQQDFQRSAVVPRADSSRHVTRGPAATGPFGDAFQPGGGPADESTFGLQVLTLDHAGRLVCRMATDPEAGAIRSRNRNVLLHEIVRGDGASQKSAAAGLHLVLRATSQLEAYPLAKAAFIRAAERWEAIIRDPISVYVDVDFGPTVFGEPFQGDEILGETFSDLRSQLYPTVLTKMLARYPNASVYHALPTQSVPTDKGAASKVAVASSVLRMLGSLPATALPGDAAPSMGFNSSFSFDFDPTDAVSPGKHDFESVVVHEIGHLLGFNSAVGDRELHPTNELVVTPWDFFRFRPGVTLAAFGTTQRILSSGGDHIFFDGHYDAPLSTGRIDGTGGDEHQAAHWQDASIHNIYYGVMNPTLPSEWVSPITPWDLDVLAWIGYSIPGALFEQSWITAISPTNVPPGGDAFTLTVDGSSFVSGATVYWKGSARPTTFVNDTRLTASILPADIATAGGASVQVLYPDGLVSNTRFFTIGTVVEAPCTPTSTSLCLADARYRVTASWKKSDGSTGDATAVRMTSDTGYFWFSNSTNVEIVTKVLNACVDPYNKYWVFAAGLTNLGVTLTYTDTKTETVKVYENPVGTAFVAVQDTQAFGTCP